MCHLRLESAAFPILPYSDTDTDTYTPTFVVTFMHIMRSSTMNLKLRTLQFICILYL